MARALRIQYPGAVYHVMHRGNARQVIFKSRKHYELFLDCLEEVVLLWNIRVHAYSLMPNHYHLLIETPEGNLSRAMRHLNHVYTQRFNRANRRDGHLFRGRYKSILVEEDAYLVELLRYIHLNPVRARLTNVPEKHEWSSHHLYLGEKKSNILTTDRLLSYFGKRKSRARQNLHAFVLDGVPEDLEKQLSGTRIPSVLSGDNFKSWIEWNFVKDLKDKEIQYNEALVEKVSESEFRKALEDIFDTSWKQLKHPQGREGQRKRAGAIHCYRSYFQTSYQKLGDIFGLSPSRISKIMGQVDIVTSSKKDKLFCMLQK